MSLRTALMLLLTLALVLPAHAGSPDASEYKVKAAFLYNLTKFVTWPDLGEGAGEISICVLGHDPFGSILDATLRGKQVAGRFLKIRRHTDLAQTSGCRLLFLGHAERSQLKRVMDRLRSANVLIVSEARSFGEAAGMINLVIDARKVRIEINVAAAHAAGLAISSRLLGLAVLTGQPPGSPAR